MFLSSGHVRQRPRRVGVGAQSRTKLEGHGDLYTTPRTPVNGASFLATSQDSEPKFFVPVRQYDKVKRGVLMVQEDCPYVDVKVTYGICKMCHGAVDQ